MIKDTRRFEWNAFLETVTAAYRSRGCRIDMRFTAEGEGFAAFVINDNTSGESRTLDAREALRELREILFPSETVRILSVYRPKHAWFGQEYIYVALERDDSAAQ